MTINAQLMCIVFAMLVLFIAGRVLDTIGEQHTIQVLQSIEAGISPHCWKQPIDETAYVPVEFRDRMAPR